jgi:lipopolysaccharide transport system permease protein
MNGDTHDQTAEQWVIEPRGQSLRSRLVEVWTFRRLFVYFGKRAVERMYQNTVLGRAWLFIRPLFPLLIRTMIFGGVLGVTAPGVPYFVFLLVGSSIWQLFASCLMWATRSLQMNRAFLGRMYFPRVIVPAAVMSAAFVNFLILMGVLAGTLIYYYVQDGRLYLASPAQAPWAIVALVLATAMALGVGLWTAPMNAEYRDVRFTLTYVLEFWALLTPIMYPLSAVPEKYHWIVYLNPLAGVIQAFKWGVLGIEGVDLRVLAIDAGLIGLVLLSGLWFFGRVEGQAVDRI